MWAEVQCRKTDQEAGRGDVDHVVLENRQAFARASQTVPEV
jgi:hypothetical protein